MRSKFVIDSTQLRNHFQFWFSVPSILYNMLRKKSREKKNFNLFIQGFCGKNVFLRLEILFAGLWTASGWLRKKPLPSFSSYCRASFFLKWLDEIKGGKERINVSDLQNDFRGSILRWRSIPPEASFSALQWNNLNLKKQDFIKFFMQTGQICIRSVLNRPISNFFFENRTAVFSQNYSYPVFHTRFRCGLFYFFLFLP